jgi:hypothetical protein
MNIEQHDVHCYKSWMCCSPHPECLLQPCQAGFKGLSTHGQPAVVAPRSSLQLSQAEPRSNQAGCQPHNTATAEEECSSSRVQQQQKKSAAATECSSSSNRVQQQQHPVQKLKSAQNSCGCG